MHVLSKQKFIEAAKKHAKDADSIMGTYYALKGANFSSPEDMRNNLFNSMDNFTYKNKWYVIDIAGNEIRLIAYINFKTQTLAAKYIVTHAEYDKLCKRYRKGEL